MADSKKNDKTEAPKNNIEDSKEQIKEKFRNKEVKKEKENIISKLFK